MSKMMKRMLLSTPSPDPLSGEDIRPFAKGELSMGRMPLLFAAQPLSGWGVKSDNCYPYPNVTFDRILQFDCPYIIIEKLIYVNIKNKNRSRIKVQFVEV